MWGKDLLVVAVCCFYVVPAFAITVDDCPSFLPRDKYLLTFGDKCYYFHMYQKVDYPDAKDACYESGGSLALVKTKGINSFLHTTLKYKFAKDVSSQGGLYFWIGLTDLEKEGHFKWADGSPMTYKNFAALQGPRNFEIDPTRIFEDCVAMNPKSGEWYDYKCRSSFLFFNEHMPYICEYRSEKHKASSTTATPSTTHSPKQTTTENVSINKSGAQPQSTTAFSRASSTVNMTPPLVSILSTEVVIAKQKTTCSSLVCNKDCGLDGYVIDPVTKCLQCSCQAP